jgi:hypothetical protein
VSVGQEAAGAEDFEELASEREPDDPDDPDDPDESEELLVDDDVLPPSADFLDSDLGVGGEVADFFPRLSVR